MAEDDEQAPPESLAGLEHVTFRVDFDLVSEWSPVLEKIAKLHGVRVAMGVDGQAMLVKLAVEPEKKARLLADVQRYWEQFVERRKREGRWSR